MDPFDGVFAPERWCVDSCVSAGFLNKPFLKITTGGTTGGSTALGGYYHVGSGMFDVVLAVASQRVGETIEAQLVLNTAVDPIYERWIGAGAITIAANQASNHFHYYGTTEEDLAMVAAKNYANALNNPYAHLQRHLTVEDALRSRMISWPLRLSDCCPSSDGACAIIFASEERARQIAKQPAWVRGAGQITDNYFAGDRPWFHDWDSLAMLARRVYKLAKISNPMAEIQVAEPYVAFSVQELMEYEALGFAEPGQRRRANPQGRDGHGRQGAVLPLWGNALHQPHRCHGSHSCGGSGPAGDGQGRQAAGAQREDRAGPLLGRRHRLSHHDDPGQGSSLEGGGRLP